MHRGLRPASFLVRKSCFSSGAIKETKVEASKENVVTLHDAPKKKPAFNRKIHKIHESKHILQDEFLNEGDLNGSARLYDYKRTGEIAASLENITERIAFVSPYERPWTDAERTWRREWHPQLVAPRKAWSIPRVPAHFDVLDFYKYITKTHVDIATPLDSIYKGLKLPTHTYNELASASLISNLQSTAFDSEEERISARLAALLDDAILSVVHARPQLAEQRVSYNSSNESFWIRGGFSFLYDHQVTGEDDFKPKIWNNQKYTGDDRRKLGELAFVHRDQLAATVRSKNPLEVLLDKSTIKDEFWSNPEKIQEALYTPRVFNMWPDGDPLWQCPGYHSDSTESHQHTVFSIKSLAGLPERISEHWKMRGTEAEEAEKECVRAQAVASAFANLVATAHIQGFTQYNDMTSPLSTQMVLSDGVSFYFAVAQLNTLAINVELEEFPNLRHNLLRIEGPFRLYDDVIDGEFHTNGEAGLNQNVLERILQMVYMIK